MIIIIQLLIISTSVLIYFLQTESQAIVVNNAQAFCPHERGVRRLASVRLKGDRAASGRIKQREARICGSKLLYFCIKPLHFCIKIASFLHQDRFIFASQTP